MYRRHIGGVGCWLVHKSDQFGVIGLLPRLELHDLWAAASGLFESAGIKWSAVNGSFGRLPCPHIQQAMAVSRMCFALFR